MADLRCEPQIRIHPPASTSPGVQRPRFLFWMLHRFDTNPETALPHLQRGTVILFLSTSEISLDDTQTLTHWKLLRALLLLLFSCSVMLDSLRPHRLEHARLLCPTSSPGKNTGMSCYLLLQGIFPTQKSKLCVSCLTGGFFPTEPSGKPKS